MWRRVLIVTIVAAVSVSLLAPPGRSQTAETVDHSALRVCADPNNLPFSNEKGEGFENKIAELLAAELDVPVHYTWFPDSVGFIRNTLNARKCDLILGTVAGNELLQSTNPYYRSTYSLIYRKDAGLTSTSLDDPRLQTVSSGVVAGTPQATALAQKGLLGRLRSYPLVVDTRFDSPARRLCHDVATGEVDVGIVWGPIAGYYAQKESPPLTVVPLGAREGPLRLDFRITMGVRFQEPEWRHTINNLLRTKQKDINSILLSYGVPLLDEQGQLITH